MKDQATERYGVVPKEMTDGVAKVNKEYEMLVLDYEESMVITLSFSYRMAEKSGSEALCYAIECVVGRMYGRIEYPRLAARKSSLEAFHFQ